MAKFIIPFIFAFYPTVLIVEAFDLLTFLWIVPRTVFAIWLLSSALSAYDRLSLTWVEVVLRTLAAFCLLVVDPLVHIPALVVGILLMAWDIRRFSQGGPMERSA